MIAAPDLARARAIPVAEIASRYTKLKRSGAWLLGCCPLHDDATPSFGIKGGHWQCFSGCGRGDVVDLVERMERLDFPDAVRWLLDMPTAARDAPVGRSWAFTEHRTMRQADADTAARVAAILAECGPVVEGTAAFLYLWSRRLKTKQPALLAHPGLWCQEVRGPLPALVAPIRGEDGAATAVQRIWCADKVEYDGSNQFADARAALVTRKKSLGSMGNGCVRLGTATATLGLSEGIETAIAASALFHIPTWAVCGAARLGLVAVPACVKTIMIFGDNGDAGRDLAARAVAHWGERNMRAQAVFPDAGYGDFQDQLIGRRS